MNLKPSFKYQFRDSIRSMIGFYIVIVLLYIAATIVTAIARSHINTSVHMQLTGIEFSTLIFLFIVGLNVFKENYSLLLQNGVSRRSVFLGHILNALALAAIAALMDKLLLAVFSPIVRSFAPQMIIGSTFSTIYSVSGAGGYALDILYNFTSFLLAISCGYFLTNLFYRLNKPGKILVGAGVPVLLFIIYPIFDSVVMDGRISQAIAKFTATVTGTLSNRPIYAVISFLVGSAIVYGLTWLLQRRAQLKPAS